MKKILATTNAPAAIGPYSQGVVAAGKLVFVAGQTPVNPATGKIEATEIKGAAKQCLTNIKAILAEEGMTMDNIVKTTVFLQDLKDFKDMNEVYATFFTGDYPARSAVQVAALPLGALCEIEAIAVEK